MKQTSLLTAIFLIACLTLGERLSLAEQTDKHIVPLEFKSQDEAEIYVSRLFAKGRISKLTVRKSQVLVMQVYGSGVPDIVFAAYALSEGRWVLVSKLLARKIGKITEPHEVTIVGDEILVVGSQSGHKSVLFRENDISR